MRTDRNQSKSGIKKMKKLVKTASLLLAAGSLLLLAGCGGKSGAQGTTAAGSAAGTAAGTAAGNAAGSAAGTAAEGTSAAAQAAAGETKDGAGTQAPEQLREMNVVLDWYPNAIHSFLYAAIERGYFKDVGLDVKIRFPANDNDALALVAAGKAEIGLYYQQDVIQAVVNQKVGVRSIGAVCQRP